MSRPLNDFALTPHFRLCEFECRCCRTAMVASELPGMLEELRAAWGRPIRITSGYRCERHNIAVGGALRSLHRLGRAVDISATRSEQIMIIDMAKAAGFSSILLGNERNYIHIAYE
ncbi:MAG: peptidase M15 [Synergistaceae bacterium]|nr:peptidase M15 [Synergistaceae bacterium]